MKHTYRDKNGDKRKKIINLGFLQEIFHQHMAKKKNATSRKL